MAIEFKVKDVIHNIIAKVARWCQSRKFVVPLAARHTIYGVDKLGVA